MAEEEKAKPIEFDAAEANLLLDVALKVKDSPALAALSKVAMINLAIMAHSIEEELEERAEALKKKGEEETAKKAAEAKKAQEEEDKKAEAKPAYQSQSTGRF